MAMLMMMKRGHYVNSDAVENVIRYVTRTRANESRADELIVWGGCGVGCYTTPELVIEQFRCVQNTYGIQARGGRRLYHETFNITADEFEWLNRDYGVVCQIAAQCAEFYFSMGYQVIFAVHYTKNERTVNKGLHIHFVINAVNFKTGKKWHTNSRESFRRENDFNMIMRQFMPREELEMPGLEELDIIYSNFPHRLVC